jgi:hypothetical protein
MGNGALARLGVRDAQDGAALIASAPSSCATVFSIATSKKRLASSAVSCCLPSLRRPTPSTASSGFVIENTAP